MNCWDGESLQDNAVSKEDMNKNEIPVICLRETYDASYQSVLNTASDGQSSSSPCLASTKYLGTDGTLTQSLLHGQTHHAK